MACTSCPTAPSRCCAWSPPPCWLCTLAKVQLWLHRVRPLQATRAASGHQPASSESKQRGTRLGHMDAALLHPFHDLDLAETRLNGYCSALGPDQQTEKCWQVTYALRLPALETQPLCLLPTPSAPSLPSSLHARACSACSLVS
jgi:hypothetical protein